MFARHFFVKINFIFYFTCRSNPAILFTTTGVVILGGERMISSDGIRGYNDAIILSILKEGESYGYAISKAIREVTEGKYIIKETTLYSAFNRLEKNQYIEAFPGDVTHGKKRTYYRITELGKKYLIEKKNDWQLTKTVVDLFI